MKKLFSYRVLVVMLILALGAHNYYLQTQVKEAINAANRAASEAQGAYYRADEAASYAAEAADNSSDAASSAEDASWYAQEVANNAFGNECWSCP